MMLLFMLEKNQTLKKFMLIQIFYALGQNIFTQHSLTNGLKKKMENLFSENQIFLLTYLTLFSGNNYIIFIITESFNIHFKKIFNYFIIYYFRFIYSGNIELENLQGPDVLKLLIAVDEINI